MANKFCPQCNSVLVSPAGPLGAEILLVGEFPGWEEKQKGLPFVGHSGEVLKAELGRVGIQYNNCRMTNLWLHETSKECDVNYHIMNLMEEMKGRKYILLMGSETTKTLLGKGVMELSGLKVIGKYLPDDAKVMVAPNPASVFHARVGEFRMAVEKFSKMVQEN